MIPMWKFAPAIACGNAFILKPSERDPGVPLRLAELMIERACPPASSMSSMATRRPWTPFSKTLTSSRGLRRLDADRRIYLRQGLRQRNGCNVSAAREPHGHHADADMDQTSMR